MALLKYVCLAILSLLVCVLVHVNYLLLQQLGGGDTATNSLPNAMTESMMKVTKVTKTTILKREEGEASEGRLHNLRKQVATMKDEIHRLKSALEKLKQQQGDDGGVGEESDDEKDEDNDDEDDASQDDGDGKSLSQR